MNEVSIVGAVIIGILAGWIAEQVMGREHGLLTNRITVIEAGHPVPDTAGEQTAVEILKKVKALTPQDLLLVLVSGGGSRKVISEGVFPLSPPCADGHREPATSRCAESRGRLSGHRHQSGQIQKRRHLLFGFGFRPVPMITQGKGDILGDRLPVKHSPTARGYESNAQPVLSQFILGAVIGLAAETPGGAFYRTLQPRHGS